MLAGLASDISQQVLRTDVAGMPLEWIDYREAVRLYHAEQVAYDCGTLLYTVFGGYSRSTVAAARSTSTRSSQRTARARACRAIATSTCRR